MRHLGNVARIMLSALFVAGLFGCASTGTKDTQERSAGRVIDDSVITTRVKAAIFEEPTLKVFQIGVKTYQGKVLLSGFVDSLQTVQKAGDVAKAVPGVLAVENALVVK